MSPSHRKAATAALILGGLFVAACGAHAADATPTASAERGAQTQTEACANCAGRMGEHHTKMQSEMAQALGMTVEELRAEMDAGKRPPQIAQERGIDFARVREAMRAAHGECSPGSGCAGRGPGAMKGHGGPGGMGMMGHSGDCPMMQARAAEPPAAGDQKCPVVRSPGKQARGPARCRTRARHELARDPIFCGNRSSGSSASSGSSPTTGRRAARRSVLARRTR